MPSPEPIEGLRAELRRLYLAASAARGGRWEAVHVGGADQTHLYGVEADGSRRLLCLPNRLADGKLAAAARNALPALFAEIDRLQPPRVVLDMRDNGGGDFTVFRESVLAAIRERPRLNRPDRLYVIIGREMFSAAMSNAADLRLQTNATLVGEPIGERPNSYQEVRFFVGRDAAGVLQVAFDAAENDFKRKLGFRQEGDWLVNNKCDTALRIEEVNSGTSGCRPAPLAHRVEGDSLVLREADVLTGWRFFR